MDSKTLFVFFILALLIQRIVEEMVSQRHAAQMLAQGGQESTPEAFWKMQLLHFLWFPAMILEVFLLNRAVVPGLVIIAGVLWAIGQCLRYAAILTLGNRWTMRIITLPDTPPIKRGLYRFMRHPNYLGMKLEIGAAPVVHNAYLTSILFGIANSILLKKHVQAEEKALNQNHDDNRDVSDHPPLVPGVSSVKNH